MGKTEGFNYLDGNSLKHLASAEPNPIVGLGRSAYDGVASQQPVPIVGPTIDTPVAGGAIRSTYINPE